MVNKMVMYTEEWISKIPFFSQLLETESINDILDSLTGLVTRGKILAYAQNLIREGTPFTFAILDLDNFKSINDTYGHKAGDDVLRAAAQDLIRFLGEDGVAGRFGGDEFLIINRKALSYDEKKFFCGQLFRGREVLQKEIWLEEGNIFITGTLGCATFPIDAANYDDLFELMDKMLYRGKTKGRNCYIIYVKEKHKDLNMKELASHSLYSTFRAMAVQYDSTPDLYEKMRRIYVALKDILWITDFYYINAKKQLKSVENDQFLGEVPDIDDLVTDELFASNDLEKIKDLCPRLYQVLCAREVESFVVARIGMGPSTFGYVMCAEPHTHRIWQDEEFAILFSLARMLAGQIRGMGLSLD